MASVFNSSIFRTPLRAVWEVSKYPTETLIWPATLTTNTKKTILFFIPGNPGLVEYYTSFLEGIYKSAASPSFEIVGVSHKGHSVNYHADEILKDNKVYSLEEQIQHKVDCLDTMIKENGPGTNFILIGHSIGCHISAEVLRRRPNHGILRVLALFPTLKDIGMTPNGLLMTPVLNRVPTFVFGIAGSLLTYMTASFRQSLVSLLTGQTGEGLYVTSHQLLTSSVLKNATAMAKEEMETIKELDLKFYAKHIDRFIIYYSAVDRWAPKGHYDYMIEHFPKGKIHLCTENLPHSFCLESPDVNYMVKKVSSWIKDDINNEK